MTLFEVWGEGAEKIGGGEESFFVTGLGGFWEAENDVAVTGIEKPGAKGFATDCVGLSD